MSVAIHNKIAHLTDVRFHFSRPRTLAEIHGGDGIRDAGHFIEVNLQIIPPA